jgi:UDP-N-acetylglucosamine 2-epimerase (non-hydrolysing)
MKIMTIVGTRPEIIRLSRVIDLLDRRAGSHILVHTGQNYDKRLNELFFDELKVRKPDINMGVRGQGFADQVGKILARSEELFREHRPDRLLVLGDTNSGLTALVARRLGIPVYHMEAGNRCYDDRVPEEVNRRVIDQCSTVLMPYTERSRQNLLAEGFPGNRVYVTGNPIGEVIAHYAGDIASSGALRDLGVVKGHYILVTMHRAENVDDPHRLRALVEALAALHRAHGHPVVCSFHPRTRARVEAFGVDIRHAGLDFVPPLGFFDFVRLEQDAFCVLSDSGTVQEEACIFQTPNVTIRDVTERPETLEGGSNVLAGADPATIVEMVEMVTRGTRPWRVPPEYQAANVADTVVRLVLGYRIPDAAEVEWREGRRG